MSSRDKPRVLILGHSFVRRLEEAIHDGRDRKLEVNLAQCEVRFTGRGGASIQTILDHEIHPWGGMVQTFRPQVVVVHAGENDLCSKRSQTVGYSLAALVCVLHQFSFVKRVVIMHLFRRRRPRYISRAHYERRRQQVNSFLTVYFSRPLYRLLGVRVRQHKRLENNPANIFKRDGIHLEDGKPMRRYWRNIRLAIMHAVADILQ